MNLEDKKYKLLIDMLIRISEQLSVLCCYHMGAHDRIKSHLELIEKADNNIDKIQKELYAKMS